MGTESSESTGGEGTVRDLAESVTLAQQFDATNEDVRNEVHTLQSSLAQPHLYRESNTRAALKDPSTSSHGEQLQHFIDGLCTKLSQPQASKDSTISHLPDHYKEHNGRQTSPAAGAEQSVQQEQTEQTNVGGEHKLSDNETSDGGYEDISRMLREAGFEGMRSNSESELKHKLAHVLQHARKKQDAIDRARSEAAEERNRASRLAKEADRLEQERAKLEREAGKKELQRESAAEASTSELNKAKEDARRARQAESSAQQQLSQLQHQYKAKERELQQLQDKLQAKADAEDRRAHRDREALQQMQQELQAERRSGNPKHAASSFSQGEIVSAYESLREQLNTQLEELRAENERLHQKVRNTSLPRGSGATLGLEVEASSVDDAEQAVEPSDTSHADGQERQRGNEVGSLQLGQEQQQQSKRSPHSPRASLRGQVKRDKKDFRLQLHLLDHLSHATLVEHVRTACRRLDLSEPARIGESISKLQKLAGMVPKLEGFVTDICSALQSASGQEVDPRSAAAEVHALMEKASQADELQKFRGVICKQLRKCSTPAVRENCTAEEAACAVADLVQVEQEHAKAKESICLAERALQSEGGGMANEVVHHFMHLFGVQSLEGVVPEMNRVHVYVSEATNVLTALRQMVGLESNATPEQLMTRLRKLLPAGYSESNDSMLLHDYK